MSGDLIKLDDMPGWYEGGKFNAGGRRPTYKVEGDWFTDLGAGRTFYVGRRQNGKYCRVYEKGKQLGNCESPWVRFEVELHNVDRVIPYDIVMRPSEYFSGCYPVCESLVDVGAERIETLRAEHEISLDRLRSYCRIAYGKLIYVLRFQVRQELKDDLSLIDDLCVEGQPRRLAKTALHMLKQAPPAGASPGAKNHG
jgi:phage replication initiation protein